VCAMEFRERHVFQSHAKAWGQAHTGPGIRFVSEDDAIEDPDHRGFLMTLSLWNKWRDQTYRNDRDAELQYLDQLPAISAANASSADKQSPAGARVKQYFTLHSEGTHTVSGTGKMAGQVLKCMFWTCNKEGCARGKAKPIKQIGSWRADLFSHLDWRGQVHGRGVVDWLRAVVAHGEVALQLEVPLPSPHHVEDY